MVVAILFLIAIFAGPFAIVISGPRLKNFLKSKQGFLWTVLKIIRLILHFIATSLGFFVGSQLIGLATSFGKLIGLFAVVTSYIGLRREYFPEIYFLRGILNRMGLSKFLSLGTKKEEDPAVFSADGTEIIRAKKSKRLGRSSGHDGHGPSGQH